VVDIVDRDALVAHKLNVVVTIVVVANLRQHLGLPSQTRTSYSLIGTLPAESFLDGVCRKGLPKDRHALDAHKDVYVHGANNGYFRSLAHLKVVIVIVYQLFY